ncbi:hypothetical protein BURMUCGD1_3554 [Burkholderia multivorans CGD1]|nr:hypothetical protein BURMUCGD1_3554 [Burkholderia multivorans CGD1]
MSCDYQMGLALEFFQGKARTGETAMFPIDNTNESVGKELLLIDARVQICKEAHREVNFAGFQLPRRVF